MAKISVICFLGEDGTSKLQSLVIKEIESSFKKNIEFKRVNAEQDKATTIKYQISELPSVVIENDGVVKVKFSGLTQGLFLKRAIERNMK